MPSERGDRRPGAIRTGGPPDFVTPRHDIRQDGALGASEWQELGNRQDPDPQAPPLIAAEARPDETERRQARFDTTLLFRDSVPTFTDHRIHYDPDCAREVEGYRGSIVHGPLLAQILMLFATETGDPLAEFSVRATSARTHLETAVLWVRGPDGRQVMGARAG